MSVENVTNNEYWAARQERIILLGEKAALDTLEEIRPLFDRAIRTIEKEVQVFHSRYAKETGMTLQEIERRLSPAELESAHKAIDRYYAEVERLEGYSPRYHSYLRNLSARAYMSRLDELKLELRHEIEGMYREVNISLRDGLSETYEDSYYRTMFNQQQAFGAAKPFTGLTKSVIDQAVSKRWLSRNFSDSIWTHKDHLLGIGVYRGRGLYQTFLNGVVLGQNPNKIARDMASEIDSKYDRGTLYNCVRLARTEFNHIANQATLDGYEKYGVVKRYAYLATLDRRTSQICGEIDGEVFNVEDAVTGLNYPPLHPNCRSTTVAHFDRDEAEDAEDELERIARDPETGKNYYVPIGTTYKQWRDGLTETQRGQLIYAPRKAERK